MGCHLDLVRSIRHATVFQARQGQEGLPDLRLGETMNIIQRIIIGLVVRCGGAYSLPFWFAMLGVRG